MSGPRIVVIPAHNEATRLPDLLAELRETLPQWTLVVIDDGSGDDTAAVATAHGARVLRHPFNLGYGAALQTGYKFALRRGASVVVQMDGDGQHLPAEIPGLLPPIEAGEADIVVGSRFLEPSGYEMEAIRSVGRHAFRALARVAGLEVTDPTSGFQALGPRALELFVADWFPPDYPDVDVLLFAVRSGLRIRETPVRMAPGVRASTLHSGWKPIYYCYKMLLSIWAATGRKAPAPES